MNEKAPETALRATETGEAATVAALATAIHDISYAGKQVSLGHAKVLANVVLGALREAGWVDPEEAARLRQDHETDMATMRLLVDKTAEFVETRKRWEAEERLLTADRDSWKGLANATLRRQEDAEAQRAEALNLLKAARNEDDYDPAPIITEYDRIVGERDELAAAVSTLASENDRLGDLLNEERNLHAVTREELVEVRHQRDRAEGTADGRGAALEALRDEVETLASHEESTAADNRNLRAEAEFLRRQVAERDALLPVVEAAREWRHSGNVTIGRTAGEALAAMEPAAEALRAAVDLWESLRPAAPGETPATVEPDDARPQPVDLGQTP